MSVVERTEQIKKSQAEQTAREKADITPFKSREDLEKEAAVKAFNESGILQNFKENEKNSLGAFKKQLYNCPDTNSYPFMNPNSIVLEWGERGVGDFYDHAYIEAKYIADTEEIILRGKDEIKFNKNEWTNKKLIEDALVVLFFNPGHYIAPVSNPEAFDGGNC